MTLGDGTADAVVLPVRFGAGEGVLLGVHQDECEIPPSEFGQLLVGVEDVCGGSGAGRSRRSLVTLAAALAARPGVPHDVRRDIPGLQLGGQSTVRRRTGAGLLDERPSTATVFVLMCGQFLVVCGRVVCSG
ncbi:hypothetical protein ACN24M_01855 [Streptomyces microflavus]|uniref:hypothetical protein n=1 Tax=Streptomyces TaxID=1883 RepID=UPI00397F3821